MTEIGIESLNLKFLNVKVSVSTYLWQPQSVLNPVKSDLVLKLKQNTILEIDSQQIFRTIKLFKGWSDRKNDS